MQAYRKRSWTSRVACGLAAVVTSTALLGGMLSLFSVGGRSVEIVQAGATSESAPVMAATLARKDGDD